MSSWVSCGPDFLRQRPKAADHVAGTVSLPHDTRDGIPRCGKVRLVPVQPAQTGAAAGYDRRQGLVDLMGNGGEQFAHRRQPRGADEFRLGVSQRLLGALALGNVHDRADEFEVTALGAVGLANTLQVFDRAIGQSDSVLMLEPASVAHGLVERMLERGPVFGLNPRQKVA